MTPLEGVPTPIPITNNCYSKLPIPELNALSSACGEGLLGRLGVILVKNIQVYIPTLPLTTPVILGELLNPSVGPDNGCQ